MKFRFHVVALPHTQTTKAFSACAFNEKVRKFCLMMHGLGHEVFLYAGEQNEAPCTEHIVCITEKERIACLEGKHYTEASFDNNLPHWRKFNNLAASEIGKRIRKKDFICVIGGLAHKPIADAFPEHMTVEFGIGYGGVFAKYQVYESYAWMHATYGSMYGNVGSDGRFFDDVIPSYFELEDFPFSSNKDNYFLYLGRLADRKGWRIAQEVCEKLNQRLIVAGPGEFSGYGEYVGIVDWRERGKLLSKARAVFMPSIYLEPFGSVHVEANLCGTPVITTDWGVFTETVINGFNGYRCRMFKDFLTAAKKVDELDYGAIRKDAISKYSTQVVAKRYEDYFKRLDTLWGKGFYA